ncbi:hypothetical protein ACFLYH_00505 [Candidatus Dependentiae bacterium]
MLKSISKKILFSLLLLVCSKNLVFAEYIFYKQNKDKVELISEKEHENCFFVLTKYAYPMSQNFDDINLDKHEEFLIKKQLPSGVRTLFIAPTLYGLFFLRCYLQNSKNKNEENNEILDLMWNIRFAYEDIMKMDTWNYKKYKDHVNELNNNDDVKKMHFLLNEGIVKYFIENRIAFPKSHCRSVVKTLVDEIILMIKNDKNSQSTIEHELMPYLITKTAVKFKKNVFLSTNFSTLIANELKAYKNQKWIIYRASDNWKPKNIVANESDSFGTRLFGGIIFDSWNDANFGSVDLSGCSFARMQISSKLHICKINIYEEERNKSFVFVPPFLALVDFLAVGEYFHARLKAYPYKERSIRGIDGRCKVGFINHSYLFADTKEFKTEDRFLKRLKEFVIKRHEIFYFK